MNDQWSISKSQTESDRSAMLSLLPGVKDRRHVRCPFHEDKVPSAEIKQVENGKYYFYCYVCGIADDYWALKARVEGKDVKEILREGAGTTVERPGFETWEKLFENWRTSRRPFKVEDVYKYADPETGEVDFAVVRYILKQGEKKQFAQAHRNGRGWKWEAPKGKSPLFNRTRILRAENVLVVEGEKCVKVFTSLEIENWAATCNPGGVNGVGKTDWTPLRGKHCAIWHDNDEPGLKHFEAVRTILEGMGCRVSRVRVEELGLELKEDIVDYLGAVDGTKEEQYAAISLVLDDAEPLLITTALDQRIKDITSGKFKHIPFVGMSYLSGLSQALIPGTVTTVCGEPGAAKSFLVLEQFWRWQLELGVEVKLLMLEEDLAFHQQRLLAQMANRSELMDADYGYEHPEVLKSAMEMFRGDIERVSRNMVVAEKTMTLSEIGDWVKEQAEQTNAEILMIDPVTAAEQNEKPWIADQKYMFTVKNAMRETGKRLFQTTHPRNGKNGAPGLSGMAGGASYPRFSQSVLWLRHFDAPKEGTFYKGGGKSAGTYKRSIEIRKARNGRGQGQNVAVELDGNTLRVRELGVIVDEV